MIISISADTLTGVATVLKELLAAMGHETICRGALATNSDAEWASASESTARDVAGGRAHYGIVCCHTGTGATMAAGKVPGIRAALCTDAYTARGARTWNDANVLGISLRLTSELVLKEMLDAWFEATVDTKQADSIAYINSL